ncbi:13790_t:CDS:1, partial [Racocetra fulgida]
SYIDVKKNGIVIEFLAKTLGRNRDFLKAVEKYNPIIIPVHSNQLKNNIDDIQFRKRDNRIKPLIA